MSAWHLGPMCAFDTETTGLDLEKDRIVTATAASITPGSEPAIESHLIAVDVDIPAEATAVHGITTEHAREHGEPAAKALEAVAAMLTEAMTGGVPLVGMNLSYDFTILDRELRRNGLATLEDRAGRPIWPVIDVRVIDKAVDRYRRGGRKLTDLCAHYGVRHDGAHDAAQDALAAARVAWKLGQRYPHVGTMDLAELHAAQIRWAADDARGLAAWFRTKANQAEHDAGHYRDREPGRADLLMQEAADLRERADRVDGAWPIQPYGGAA